MNVNGKHIEDEIMVTIGMIVVALFSFLSVSQDAGIVLFMMVIAYFVTVASRTVKEVEIIRGSPKAREPLKIIGIIFAITAVWIVANSLIYSASVGTFSLYNPAVFHAIFAQANIPILASEPYIILFIWGFVFPVIESMFFLSVVLLLYNRMFLRSWQLPKKINSKNIGKVVWVAMLVGATASLIHLQVRQAAEWALLGDFVFFSLSTVVVYKTRQILEAMGVHAVINSLVLLLGG